MSKLVWKQLKIRDAGSAAGDGSEIVISNVITEGIEFTGDGKVTVAIANNQEVTESYMRGFTVRVKGTVDDDGAAILSNSNVYSDPAIDTLTLALMELVGETGSETVAIDNVYIMGENDLSNGRREVVLSCQLESISDSYSFS